MKICFRLSLISGLFLYGSVWATGQPIVKETLPVLHEQPQQVTASSRVTERFTQSHYRKFDLDEAFSTRIFNRYLSMLDYNHSIFLSSDIDKFSSAKQQLGTWLKSGHLDDLFNLFNLFQQRRLQRYQYALSVLKAPMNFNGEDTIDLDRSKSAWPEKEADLNALWNSRVKYDELSLKLVGKTDDQIRSTLTKRYNTAIHQLTQVHSEDVFQLIMNAFAHEIDPHTNYLSPRNTEQFNTEMSLSLDGIGAVLQMDEDSATINSLVTGGPAARSNLLKVGDKILGVGQQGKPIEDIIGLRLDDVVEKIKGPKGSRVRLEILPAIKGAKPKIITLVRDRIRLEDRAVQDRIKQVGKLKIGVLDIPGFYVGLTDDVKVKLQKLHKEKIDSLVIDLRNNGGGALTEAVALSGLFIEQGPVVQVRDNSNNIHQDNDNDSLVYYKGPLVVLVNRLSASASEIFSAAMQDYGRGIIIGETTFGKGTVQQYSSLSRIYDAILKPDWPPLGSIQYTIQKFYRINGGSTQRDGVTPDITFPSAIDTFKTGEKYEDNALPWDSIKPADYHKMGSLQPYVKALSELHKARIAKDMDFQNIISDITRFNAISDKINILSLNYQQRQKQIQQEDKLRLDRVNAHLKQQHKPTITSVDMIPKDYREPDPYLTESINIAGDLAQLQQHEKSSADGK